MPARLRTIELIGSGTLIVRYFWFCPSARMLWSAADLAFSIFSRAVPSVPSLSFLSYAKMSIQTEARVTWGCALLEFLRSIWCLLSLLSQLPRHRASCQRTKQSTDLVWSRDLPTIRPAAMNQEELQSAWSQIKGPVASSVSRSVLAMQHRLICEGLDLDVLSLNRGNFVFLELFLLELKVVRYRLCWISANILQVDPFPKHLHYATSVTSLALFVSIQGIVKRTNLEALDFAFPVGIHLIL